MGLECRGTCTNMHAPQQRNTGNKGCEFINLCIFCLKMSLILYMLTQKIVSLFTISFMKPFKTPLKSILPEEGCSSHSHDRNITTQNPPGACAIHTTAQRRWWLVSVRRCIAPRQHQYQLRRATKPKTRGTEEKYRRC